MTSSDQEMLEMAAKVAGAKRNRPGVVTRRISSFGPSISSFWTINGMPWAPLDDDGDALRLAVSIGLFTTAQGLSEFQMYYSDEIAKDGLPTAATRRAIVFIAAAFGRAIS